MMSRFQNFLCAWRYILLSRHPRLPEQSVAVREQSGDEDAAEEDTADELAGTDGQCQEPECARDRVGIAENQRDDDAV